MRSDMRTARRWFGQCAVKAARGAMGKRKEAPWTRSWAAARARDDMRLGLRDAVKLGRGTQGKTERSAVDALIGRRRGRGMKRDWACATPSKLKRGAQGKTERSAVDALMDGGSGAGLTRDWVCATPSKLRRAARWKTERSAVDAHGAAARTRDDTR